MLATLFDVDLAEVCITSNYEVRVGEMPAGAFRLDAVPGVAVVVEKAYGTKCARSWKILPTVGDDPEYPDVTPRDAQALREWKALGVGVQFDAAPAKAGAHGHRRQLRRMQMTQSRSENFHPGLCVLVFAWTTAELAAAPSS